MRRLIAFFSVVFCLAGTPALPGELEVVPPEQIGLSTKRLARIDRVMRGHVDADRMVGGIGLIARRGKIGYFQTWGQMDKENSKPMRKDAIFRMYSMTKAVTGVATMILLEEGHFFLDDPVSKFLPELGGLEVAVDETDAQTGKRVFYTTPSRRDITIQDLLRHTSGLSYRGPRDADGELFFRKADVSGSKTIEEMIKRIAKAPLLHQPGTTYRYGYSTDVLARLVEVVSGTPVNQFFEERIFEPLKMATTGYHVPEGDWDRFTTLYAPNKDKTLRRSTSPAQDKHKKPTTLFQGGDGLVSTTMDYARFCQMLANNGELDGARILSRKSVELMSADHLSHMPQVGNMPGWGYGLTFAVNRGPGKTGRLGSKGEYRWGGAAGTRFWIDPAEEMIGVFMVQILPHSGLTYGDEFKRLAYQAIAD